MHRTPRANVFGSSDMVQDFFGPTDQTLSSTSTDTATDPDNLFNSPISFSTDLSKANIFAIADFYAAGIDSNSNGSESLSNAFPVSDKAIAELFAHSIPSKIRPPPALGSMKQLSPSPSNPCMTWATHLDNATAIPTIQAVIAPNEAIIEAVSTMLQCSCSQDAYLLSVMSLIIFKVLGWYAAVARKTTNLQSPHLACRSRPPSPFKPVLQNPTIVGGSYCLDGADSARTAAQLVLSELYRVRRLVDQLLSKPEAQAAKKGRGAVETPESMDLMTGWRGRFRR